MESILTSIKKMVNIGDDIVKNGDICLIIQTKQGCGLPLRILVAIK